MIRAARPCPLWHAATLQNSSRVARIFRAGSKWSGIIARDQGPQDSGPTRGQKEPRPPRKSDVRNPNLVTSQRLAAPMAWNFGLLAWCGFLLAAAAPAKAADDDANMRLLGNGLLMVGALLIGAMLIAWAQRWRRSMIESPNTMDELASFRSSYERGELSEDEYRRIRARIGGAKLPTSARPEQTPESTDLPPSERRTPEPPAAE